MNGVFNMGVIAAAVRRITGSPTGYRFWRLNITQWATASTVGSTGDTRISELKYFTAAATEWPLSAMTGPSSPSPYVASASTSASGRPAEEAFNKIADDSHRWISGTAGGAQWLQIDMGSTVDFTSVSITPDDAVGSGYYPVDFNIKASNTGAFTGEEVEFLSVTGLTTGWANTTPRTFALSSALVFTAGTNIILTDSNRTAASASSWVTSPLNRGIPSSGKTFVEFTVNGGDKQMLGVMVGNTPQTQYLGQFADSVSNGDDIRVAGSVFSVSVSGNLSSSSSDFGVAVDQSTGVIRWYINGVLQSPSISFTPGTSGLYFAAGLFNGRPTVTVKQSSANTPSGYSYQP